MRLQNAIIVVLLLAAAGCNLKESADTTNRMTNSPSSYIPPANEPVLEVPLHMALVEVLPYEPDSTLQPSQCDVDLRVAYGDSLPCNRVLRLARSTGPDGSGAEVQLLDNQDQLIVSVTQRWLTDEWGVAHHSMVERTPDDSLFASIAINGDSVREFYEINGESAEFEYTISTPSEDSAGNAFMAYYSAAPWSAAHTLDQNNEGMMMMGLVSDTAFANWALREIVPEEELPPLGKIACDEECHTCAIASICSYFKCEYGGGMLNFMCDACVGVHAACIITYVARLFM